MARSLKGKKALITGGAVRIGRATVLHLARAGVDPVIHYNHSREDAEAVQKLCEDEGVNAHLCSGDLSDPEGAAEVLDEACQRAGTLDILVNNASIFPTDNLQSMTRDSILQNLDVNALAPAMLSRRFAETCESGDIVNLLDCRIVDYDQTHVSYHISKRVLFTFTKMMAVEYAPSFRVNAVAPGLVLPPSGEDLEYLESLKSTNPLHTHGEADDVAEAVVFLLQTGFTTGQTIFVDGGRNLLSGLYD